MLAYVCIYIYTYIHTHTHTHTHMCISSIHHAKKMTIRCETSHLSPHPPKKRGTWPINSELKIAIMYILYNIVKVNKIGNRWIIKWIIRCYDIEINHLS